MGKKLVIKGADFSENGISPFIETWYNDDLTAHPPGYGTIAASGMFVPGNYPTFQNKTINLVKFKVITPGTITIAVADRITANAVISQVRVLDCSGVPANTIVTKKFNDITVGSGYIAFTATTDTGSVGYAGNEQNPLGLHGKVGQASVTDYSTLSPSINFGYGHY